MELMIAGFDTDADGHAILNRVNRAAATIGQNLDAIGIFSNEEPPTLATVTDGTYDGVAGCALGLLVALAHSGGATAAIGGVVRGLVAGIGREAIDNAMIRMLATPIGQRRSVLLALGDGNVISTIAAEASLEDVVRHQLPDATRSLVELVSSLSIDDIENSLMPVAV